MPLAPLPENVRRHLARNTHPGLLLDKYAESWDDSGASGEFSEKIQTPTVKAIVELSRQCPDPQLWQELRQRRKHLLNALGAALLPCVTTGPLTLHLARASALENAGICLHRVYGFAYLPGSGVKGLARAWAEEAEKADAADVKAVFGTTTASGQIIFHDAWPTEWPGLIADIINNHHRDYYGAPEGDQSHPPGDWEEPSMVSFLAVPAGVTFDFPLSKRRANGDDRLLKLARRWLLGGLAHLGAGAKTAAGYGAFRPLLETSPLPASRANFETTLELVTPAFLAGPNRGAEDCELRPATLRGLLRWWWRTIHAGYVDVATLRRMEAAVWGDTRRGSAVRITVEPHPDNSKPQHSPLKRMAKNNKGQDVLRFDRGFGNEHGIEIDPIDRTQGILYASYGMDEMDAGKRETRVRRWYREAGSRWRIRVSARESEYVVERDARGKVVTSKLLPASLVLDQARLALWWLSHLGGLGSKCRKGYGSLADVTFPTFDGALWLSHGKTFRQACGLPENDFIAARVTSPALKQMRELADRLNCKWLQVRTPWNDPWRVLDEIGKTMQAFAQAPSQTKHGKHCPSKRHLGLPRSIDRKPHEKKLQGAHGDRHPSPALYHVTREEGHLQIRVAAFPSADTRSPDTGVSVGWQESQDLLEKLLRYLQQHLCARVEQAP